MTKIRSFERWVHEKCGKTGTTVSSSKKNITFTTRADLIVREPECQDVNCPPVGTEMLDVCRRHVTIASGPKWDKYLGCVTVMVEGKMGEVYTQALSRLGPLHPKRYHAVYEGRAGESEAEVPERYGIPEGVTLEEK